VTNLRFTQVLQNVETASHIVSLGTNLIRGEKCVISRDVSENMPNFHGKFTGPTDVVSRCYAKAEFLQTTKSVDL